jgi:hypothetical protein
MWAPLLGAAAFGACGAYYVRWLGPDELTNVLFALFFIWYLGTVPRQIRTIQTQIRLVRGFRITDPLLRLVRWTQLINSKREYRLDRPPGWQFLRIARVIFSQKVADRVFGQTVRDINEEYLEALHEKNYRLAQWIRIRGYIALAHTLILQMGMSTLKQIFELWKLGK